MSAPLIDLRTQAAGIRTIRDAITELLRNGHGKTEYTIATSGEVLPAERVETDRMKEGETLEAFLVRVWAGYKVGPGKSIGFSVHDGHLTARITTRPAADDDRLAELSEQIARLSAQLGAIGAYIEHTRAVGEASPEAHAFPLSSAEFTSG